MALDPSIILNLGRGVTPLKSPAEIQDEQMQREVNSLKLGQMRQGIQDEQATRDIARNTAPEGLADAYYKGGYVKQGQEAQKFQTEQQKSKREALKAQVEQNLLMFEKSAQIMNGVTDQATWDRARQQTAQIFGPEAAQQMPAQYDPALIEQKRAQALTVKQQLEEKWKAMEYSTPNANAKLQAQTSSTNNANTVAATDRATNQRAASAAAAAQQKTAPKPIPATALKMQQESLDAIGTANSINADLDAITTQIDSGKLSFGPMSNLANSAMNATGFSSEESRNFASFKSNLEKLRNDPLRLNKGVQTDGDAQRAWNELFTNINDTKLVQQRLGEIKRLNERAVQLRKLDIDAVRTNYGHEPLDVSGYEKQPATLNGGASSPAKSKITVGTVDSGYRYKGGDPKSPSSWEQVK
jgi:hypothetical protein